MRESESAGGVLSEAIMKAVRSAAEGQRFMDMFRAANGGERRWVPNDDGSYSDLWRVELIRRMSAGETRSCPHLAAADLSYWLPYRPLLLGCAACRDKEVLQVQGTPEDDICDHCGGTDKATMHPVCIQVPGGVMNRGGAMVAIGPVTITGGLCDQCFRRDPHIPDDAGRGRRPPRD